MASAWRLLVDRRPCSGWWNMAVDEVLLATTAAGAPPVLRLYAWRGPWLSLGYAQPFDAEAAGRCAAAGVQVLRRSTGGRAVLHGRDLTYTVAAHERALPAGLEGSYRLLSQAIACALTSLGIAAERAPAAPAAANDAGFDCFAAPAADELSVGGRKLAGSAQRRAGGGVLQHGSIRLAPDPPAAAAAAGFGPGATSLAELGIPAPRARRVLGRALPDALARGLGVALAPAALTADERRASRALAASLRRDPLARRRAGAVAASRAR